MVTMKRPDKPAPIAAAAKKKPKQPAEKFFSTRYLRHPTMGIVLWTTPNEFPGFWTHADMAKALPKAFKHNDIAGGDERKIESAGYVVAGNDGPICVGRSDSLGVKADPDDTDLLRAMLERASW